MPKTYLQLDPADERYHKILDVMDKHHRHLRVADVKLTILMASGPRDQNGDVSGPAITVGGYQAMASIKITTLEQRVAGLGDAILKLDADRIDTLSEAELVALYDHEIFHLDLVIDKNGAVARDDCGRPKLKAKKHDIQIGGFSEIIKRHKRNALEAQQIDAAYVEYVQPAFNFG